MDQIKAKNFVKFVYVQNRVEISFILVKALLKVFWI